MLIILVRHNRHVPRPNANSAEITYIAVEQAHRRTGLGSKLMQVAFDRARAQGLPLFITSEPQVHGFCDKLGFKVVKHADMDLAQLAPPFTGFGMFRLYGMIWKP